MSDKMIKVSYKSLEEAYMSVAASKENYAVADCSWPELTGKGAHVDSLSEIRAEYDNTYREILGLYDSLNEFINMARIGFEAADSI